MTVKELKTQLSNAEDSYSVAVETPNGNHDITQARIEGDTLTFWTSPSS